MKAAETIAQAIEKLEGLATSPGPWAGWRQYSPLYGFRYGIEDADSRHVAAFERDADTALVEVLHRTIDAQLAILRHVADQIGAWSEEDARFGWSREIALANAILGENS